MGTDGNILELSDIPTSHTPSRFGYVLILTVISDNSSKSHFLKSCATPQNQTGCPGKGA